MTRGGARKGAGRPKGQGKYNEPTKPIRIPESMVGKILEYVQTSGYKLPIYSSSVQAGFPSPAEVFELGQLVVASHLKVVKDNSSQILSTLPIQATWLP